MLPYPLFKLRRWLVDQWWTVCWYGEPVLFWAAVVLLGLGAIVVALVEVVMVLWAFSIVLSWLATKL